jgi:hypothetical protein
MGEVELHELLAVNLVVADCCRVEMVPVAILEGENLTFMVDGGPSLAAEYRWLPRTKWV